MTNPNPSGFQQYDHGATSHGSPYESDGQFNVGQVNPPPPPPPTPPGSSKRRVLVGVAAGVVIGLVVGLPLGRTTAPSTVVALPAATVTAAGPTAPGP